MEVKISELHRKKGKEYMKYYDYKRKSLLQYLINCIEELENLENKHQFLNSIKCAEKLINRCY